MYVYIFIYVYIYIYIHILRAITRRHAAMRGAFPSPGRDAEQKSRGPGPEVAGNPLLFYSERGILYYSTPREESFTILLRERNPYSKGFLSLSRIVNAMGQVEYVPRCHDYVCCVVVHVARLASHVARGLSCQGRGHMLQPEMFVATVMIVIVVVLVAYTRYDICCYD